MHLYVSSLKQTDVEKYAKAYGKDAVLYRDKCKQCQDSFFVHAYTALAYFKRGHKFIPFRQCSKCHSTLQKKRKGKLPKMDRRGKHAAKYAVVCGRCFHPRDREEVTCNCGAAIHVSHEVNDIRKLDFTTSFIGAAELEGRLVLFDHEGGVIRGVVVAFSCYGIAIADSISPEAVRFARMHLHDDITNIRIIDERDPYVEESELASGDTAAN